MARTAVGYMNNASNRAGIAENGDGRVSNGRTNWPQNDERNWKVNWTIVRTVRSAVECVRARPTYAYAWHLSETRRNCVIYTHEKFSDPTFCSYYDETRRETLADLMRVQKDIISLLLRAG